MGPAVLVCLVFVSLVAFTVYVVPKIHAKQKAQYAKRRRELVKRRVAYKKRIRRLQEQHETALRHAKEIKR